MIRKIIILCVAWLVLVGSMFFIEFCDSAEIRMRQVLGHGAIGVLGVSVILFFGIKLNRSYEIIQRQAVIDGLTGIYNFRAFIEQMAIEFKRCVRDGKPLSCIMADVDYFKTCNDTYGHAAGDDCLRKVAQVIKETIQRPGDFCARYGGDEFVVLLSDTDEEAAELIAENIRSNVEITSMQSGRMSSPDHITISLGVATSSNQATDSCEELLRQADQALYAAKENGRNRVEVHGRYI